MGNMTDVHVLSDQDLADTCLHHAWGDLDVDEQILEEVRRRWPYLACMRDTATWLIASSPAVRSGITSGARARASIWRDARLASSGEMLELVDVALGKIVAGGDPAATFDAVFLPG